TGDVERALLGRGEKLRRGRGPAGALDVSHLVAAHRQDAVGGGDSIEPESLAQHGDPGRLRLGGPCHVDAEAVELGRFLLGQQADAAAQGQREDEGGGGEAPRGAADHGFTSTSLAGGRESRPWGSCWIWFTSRSTSSAAFWMVAMALVSRG